MQFILASQSPRRQQLLRQIGIADFEIIVPDADETYDPALSPEQIVSSISRKKAEAVRPLAKDALVIAADTMVFLDGLRLGKPKTQEEAREMLTALSGRTHHVCTGVTVCRGPQVFTESETTSVTFRPLTGWEIARYVLTGEPMDKAGSYGVQGLGALFVEHIDGDYFNVMGLPLCRLGRMLKRFGVDPFFREEDQ
ncbi:MAG: septum formation inhibitor Maf [Oscillospiraceae bacterium]|nr:septum formation inhibitor Maf [Oscillospiraceae bacterium]MCI8877483.1 septum formation inhibitor Maf [Oscillospiraceae bacterium]